MVTLNWFVQGDPTTKGSKVPFHRKDGSLGVREQTEKKQRPWVALLKDAAEQIFKDADGHALPPWRGPVEVRLEFYFKRPQKHFRTGKHAAYLRGDAPLYVTGRKSDADKLARCVLDALTGIVYEDDGQVVPLHVDKRYVGLVEGCEWQRQGVGVSVREIPDRFTVTIEGE